MAWLRHPTITFNFIPPGEPFEALDENVEYLIETYGCELLDSNAPVPPLVIEDAVESDIEPELEEPIHVGGGWYSYNGEKLRKRDLPPEALEALDG
jgi:hypothetical protein